MTCRDVIWCWWLSRGTHEHTPHPSPSPPSPTLPLPSPRLSLSSPSLTTLQKHLILEDVPQLLASLRSWVIPGVAPASLSAALAAENPGRYCVPCAGYHPAFTYLVVEPGARLLGTICQLPLSLPHSVSVTVSRVVLLLGWWLNLMPLVCSAGSGWSSWHDCISAITTASMRLTSQDQLLSRSKGHDRAQL